MRVTLLRVLATSMAVLLTIYFVYFFQVVVGQISNSAEELLDAQYSEIWSPWKPRKIVHLKNLLDGGHQLSTHDGSRDVEIWGKAAIGQYLWEHILGGSLEADNNGLIKTGSIQTVGVNFRYRTGPGLIPTTVPEDVVNLILVLNGRESGKIKMAKVWLNMLPQLTKLRHVAVVLLGNERCRNQWMDEYKRLDGGRVDLTFLVYDSMDVDGTVVYQWPLGVATYRNFPLEPKVDTTSSRRHVCSFAGTVYEYSSREQMMRILGKTEIKKKCAVLPRYTWAPGETEASMDAYRELLSESDLALCPVGKNAESYRIYEAMAMGSVPVIENLATAGLCSKNPFRLLKELKAPVIFIVSWEELPGLLDKEAAMTDGEKRSRRRSVVKWYSWFKLQMKERFVNSVTQAFFD